MPDPGAVAGLGSRIVDQLRDLDFKKGIISSFYLPNILQDLSGPFVGSHPAGTPARPLGLDSALLW